MNITFILVIIGFLFSPIAALATFLITYEEYLHHEDKRLALRITMQTAILTLVGFIALTFGINFFFAKIITE